MRILIRGFIICLLALISTPVSTHRLDGSATAGCTITNNPENNNDTDSKTCCIALTGDIMMGSYFPDSTLLPRNDGHYLLRYVSSFFTDADIVCGNLEGVMADTGGTLKSLRYPDSAYYFKMPLHFAQHLKNAGYDFISLANNHVFDFGAYGKNMTKQALDEAGVHYAGLTECPFKIISKKNVNYGFIAFAPNSGTLNLKDSALCVNFVRELSHKCDVLIVSFHGGGEGTDFRNITREPEIYMGENRGNVYAFAHAMIDAGADVVFGHGPHLTRALELYGDRLIMYSLGNFCSYGRINRSGLAGLAPIIKVNTDHQGRFLSGEIIPVKHIKKGIPVYDHTYAVVKEIQKLTAEDFPETPLHIDDNGILRPKPCPVLKKSL